MLNLVRNENMKIYFRLRTWSLFSLLGVAIILTALFLYSGQNMMKALGPTSLNAWTFSLQATNDLQTLLFAFVAVIGGDIVAGEFSAGTIHMLLTESVSRSKILASKYLAALLFSLFMTLSMLILSWAIGGVFFGFAGASVPQTYVGPNHTFHQMAVSSYLFMQYGFLYIEVTVTTTIAIMISTLFRSSALAITVAIMATLMGPTLAVAVRNYSWDKYLLFVNADLSQYVIRGPLLHGMRPGFSISMLIAYLIVMIGLAWMTFVKRDVSHT
ncbi:ABC transporter permease [Alicyclobacillus kakegawensis]|uniref:ABC transporter permease n=1 Tax=Alicyclobacillus kakegawensis TaxID=392012 RepID=UPI000830E3EF|nr:ABC transporter permease [Alicyclobacillus kakegawensis]